MDGCGHNAGGGWRFDVTLHTGNFILAGSLCSIPSPWHVHECDINSHCPTPASDSPQT
jgi:hypothetical protein